MTIEFAEHDINYLTLYLVNEHWFYDSLRDLRINYAKRIKRGSYDNLKALKGIKPFIIRAINDKRFVRDNGNIELSSSLLLQLAEEVLNHYQEEIKDLADQ